MRRTLLSTILAATSLALASLPAQAASLVYKVQILGVESGKQALSQGADGLVEADYSFADRGRGDHVVARWKLGADGIPVQYDGSGNDYWAAPFTEHYHLKGGKASWNSRAEAGEQALSAPAFYLPANPPPELQAVLVRALLKAPGQRLALLPSGQAQLEVGATLAVDGAHGKVQLTQYRVNGLGFTPVPVWLDADGRTAAVLSDWISTVAPDYLDTLAPLVAAQGEAKRAWAARLAREQTVTPGGALLIRHARLYDPRDLSVTPNMSVLVDGERVIQVDLDDKVGAPAGAMVIDAAGRFLMPGLWDCHQHFGDTEGIFDLIAGVTSARDMANDNLPILARVARFDAGTELGPRVLLAGIIEGVGPLAGPTDVRVDTPEKARAAVDWYADHGYVQVKIYSSLDTKLVPVVAARAHARGLRVSGHVPAFTFARQFVEDGADEIQHLNFVVLNLLYPQVQETRNKDRYIVVADQAANFGPEQPRMAEFIAFLRRHHTVLDPTMGVLEELYARDPAKVGPSLAPVAPRFPAQIRRGLKSIGLVAPSGHEAAYGAAFPALEKLLKALYDAGVTILPGTDAFAGYSLHHELELYARAGIAPREVLRIATLTPAQVMGVDKDRGVIAPGKLADMLLVDGDPSRDIGDIRHIYRTIKGGKLYDPAALERALGLGERAP